MPSVPRPAPVQGEHRGCLASHAGGTCKTGLGVSVPSCPSSQRSAETLRFGASVRAWGARRAVSGCSGDLPWDLPGVIQALARKLG